MAARTTSSFWKDKSNAQINDHEPLIVKESQKKRIAQFHEQHGMKDLIDQREFQVQKDKLLKPRTNALVTTHTKCCFIEAMAKELDHPKPL